MPLEIAGVDHVQIAVPQAKEAECLAFYHEVLGLAEIPKPAELRARGGAWFAVGTIQIHVGVDPYPSPKSKRHICFLVKDMAAAKAHVKASGIVIEEESVAEGLSRFFIRDPASNRIELGKRV